MTTYNGEKYLAEQLASFAAQSRKPDELVITDDGSSDDTLTIAREFAGKAPFAVHVHNNPQRLGIAGNFGHAIELATGDVIFLSDQDDAWKPEKLAAVAAIFERRPEVGLVCHDAEVMDEAMRPKGFTSWRAWGFTPAM